MVIFVIKDIRSKKNINLYKLSKLTGITRSYLRDLENNKKNNPTIHCLVKIADALGVGVKDLFYDNLEIEELKQQLNENIDKTGLHSKETMEISHIIDLLVNVEWYNKKNINGKKNPHWTVWTDLNSSYYYNNYSDV